MNAFVFDRVYFHLGKEYHAELVPLEKLIEQFVKAPEVNTPTCPFMDRGRICHAKVRKVLNSAFNAYIEAVGEYEANISMRNSFSAVQYKRLMSAYMDRKKSISAFVFLFIYFVLFESFSKGGDISHSYDEFACGFRALLDEYYVENPDDEMAHFALSCDTIILERCRDGIVFIPPSVFPPIPRRTVHDNNL